MSVSQRRPVRVKLSETKKWIRWHCSVPKHQLGRIPQKAATNRQKPNKQANLNTPNREQSLWITHKHRFITQKMEPTERATKIHQETHIGSPWKRAWKTHIPTHTHTHTTRPDTQTKSLTCETNPRRETHKERQCTKTPKKHIHKNTNTKRHKVTNRQTSKVRCT